MNAAARKRPNKSRIDSIKRKPWHLLHFKCNSVIEWLKFDVQVKADGTALVQHSPFTWFPYGVCGVRPVSPGCCWKTHRMVWAHTNARWAGGNTWCPARSLPPTVWWWWVCHRASCSLLRLCVLLSPHRSVLQEGRRWEGESSAEDPPPPLCSVQSQRSSAGSRCCSLSPYRLCRLQVQSEILPRAEGVFCYYSISD